MPDQYRRRATDVVAAQFTGGEDSAAAVIAWAAALPTSVKVETYQHLRFDRDSGDDEGYETWLKVRRPGFFLAPGDWLVVEAGEADVYTATEFEAEYELSEATA